MGYLLYSLTFMVFALFTTLFFTRSRWLPLVTDGRSWMYSRLPNSFGGDIEAGLSSNTFSLAGNVESGDSRAGLDDTAKAEILRIMKKRRLQFDDARKVYMEQRFSDHGIDADGRPRDPKFVSFS